MTASLVASSSGGRCGAVWDRHFGCPLATLFTEGGLTCAALDPSLEQVCAAADDRGGVRIWRTRECVRKLERREGERQTTDHD